MYTTSSKTIPNNQKIQNQANTIIVKASQPPKNIKKLPTSKKLITTHKFPPVTYFH